MCVCVLGSQSEVVGVGGLPLYLVSSPPSVLLEAAEGERRGAGCSCCSWDSNKPPPPPPTPLRLGFCQTEDPLSRLKGALRSVPPYFIRFGLLLRPYTHFLPNLSNPSPPLDVHTQTPYLAHSSEALLEADIIR